MENPNPKPFSETLDKRHNQSPKTLDNTGDNASFTPKKNEGHLTEPNPTRTGNSIETVTSSARDNEEGGMIGEG